MSREGIGATNRPSAFPDFHGAGLAPAEVRDFLHTLQAAVREENRPEVASLVSYPIIIRLDGQPVRLQTPEEFVARYWAIMTGRVKQAVLQAELGRLFVNYQGIRLGRGELWFAGVYEEGQEHYRLRIIAINTGSEGRSHAPAARKGTRVTTRAHVRRRSRPT